jgi:hypothetical protein
LHTGADHTEARGKGGGAYTAYDKGGYKQMKEKEISKVELHDKLNKARELFKLRERDFDSELELMLLALELYEAGFRYNTFLSGGVY